MRPNRHSPGAGHVQADDVRVAEALQDGDLEARRRLACALRRREIA